MSEDITKRLMDLSETMMEGMPYNDGDFTILDEACSEIERLRTELCTAWEQAERWKDERDEARREVCNLEADFAKEHGMFGSSQDVADERGWDCFKEAQ